MLHTGCLCASPCRNAASPSCASRHGFATLPPLRTVQAKCSVQPLPFYLSEGNAGALGAAAIRAQLDGATVAAAARGIAVRGLLVTNPNNPLGTIYQDGTITEMLKWCLDSHMHFIRCAATAPGCGMWLRL